MSEEMAEFYAALGYKGPAPDEMRGGMSFAISEGEVEPAAVQRLPLSQEELEQLEQLFMENPEVVMAWFRDAWDEDITEDDVWFALSEARMTFDSPSMATASLSARTSFLFSAQKLPDDFTFEGIDLPNIEIDPGIRKFETKGDVLGWLFLSAPQLLQSKATQKAPFPWHDDPGVSPDFVYPLNEPPAAGSLDVALFSDFGTGYYHSRYIAKQFLERKFPYAIHLGDVYYAGEFFEFKEYFEGPLDPILPNTTLYTLNANHEMLSGGWPYFDYIKRRLARPNQHQEGSYFALRSSQYQIVGIDTDYHSSARYENARLQDWLNEMLKAGRKAGLINILLSPAHPYDHGSTRLTNLIKKDLKKPVLSDKLVDLWFWGNTHYCGLYDRSADLPFIGSCIGHGGYPYSRKSEKKRSAAPMRFLETEARFPKKTGIRQDRGNNGYCLMRLGHDGRIVLEYIDWMSRLRHRATLARDAAGVLRFADGG